MAKKVYRVGVWEEQSGYINVRAGSKKEASELALNYLDDTGIDKHADVTYRDTFIVDAPVEVDERSMREVINA